MRIQRILNELCIFKNRASSSPNELKAAQHINQLMRNLGLVASMDEFKSQKRMTWELVTILVFFLIEVGLFLSQPIASLVFGMIGLVLFWGYFTTTFRPLGPLFKYAKSHNVVGKLMRPDATFKIIFTAHYDTARSGPMWNPKTVSNFRFNFLSGFFLLIALQIIVALKIFAIEHIALNLLLYFGGIHVIVQIFLLIYAGFKGELVQGASDNASGVAVMMNLAAELKDTLHPNIEFWFVATGSEEVGANGMTEFMKMYGEDFEPNNTYFINFDNIGSGNLHYYTGEGMLQFFRFSKDLVAAAKKASQKKEFKSVTPAKYTLAYTDAIIPASRGWDSILFLATDNKGHIPNWHWPTDTMENIDFAVPRLASDFTREMLRQLDTIFEQKRKEDEQNMKQYQQDIANSADVYGER